MTASSRRCYAQTLGRLQAALGEDRLVDRVGGREFERAIWEAWGETAPAAKRLQPRLGNRPRAIRRLAPALKPVGEPGIQPAMPRAEANE